MLLAMNLINHWNKLAVITEGCPFAFLFEIKD